MIRGIYMMGRAGLDRFGGVLRVRQVALGSELRLDDFRLKLREGMHLQMVRCYTNRKGGITHKRCFLSIAFTRRLCLRV